MGVLDYSRSKTRCIPSITSSYSSAFQHSPISIPLKHARCIRTGTGSQLQTFTPARLQGLQPKPLIRMQESGGGLQLPKILDPNTKGGVLIWSVAIIVLLFGANNALVASGLDDQK